MADTKLAQPFLMMPRNSVLAGVGRRERWKQRAQNRPYSALSLWSSSRNNLRKGLLNRLLFYLTKKARPFVTSEDGFRPRQTLVNRRFKHAQHFQPDEINRVY